jgi:hypothetical protein
MIRESVELEVQLIDDLLDLTKIAQYVAYFFIIIFFLLLLLFQQSGYHCSTISEP